MYQHRGRTAEASMTTEPHYTKDLEFVIAQVWADGSSHSKLCDDGKTEVYAYKHVQGVAYGVNGGPNGFNILRGVRKADGDDVMVL
jgi:hypothetical protein